MKYLQQQLFDIALTATDNKAHIQQMSTAINDLLCLGKQEQQQITALTKQNGDLIVVLAKLDATNTSHRQPAAPGTNLPPRTNLPPKQSVEASGNAHGPEHVSMKLINTQAAK